MKALVQVEVLDATTARAAARIVGKQEKRGRAALKGFVKGSELHVVVESPDFASLRAGTTSVFRDLKVFLDSAKAVGRVRKK